MRTHENFRDMASMELDIEATLGAKPNEAWSQAEREAASLSLVPLVFHLGTIALTDPDRARTFAQNVSTFCRKRANSASNPQLWVSAATIIDYTFVSPVPPRELNALGNTFGQEQDQSLRVMSYLGSTLQQDCHLNDALNAHSAIVPWVAGKYLLAPITYQLIVLPFFLTYWQAAFERKRGLFSHPRRVQATLSRALTMPEKQRVQAVLKAVALGLNGDANILQNL